MAHVLSDKAKRRVLDKLHDGSIRERAKKQGIDYDGAFAQSEDTFMRRVCGRRSMTVPELPWKRGKRKDKP